MKSTIKGLLVLFSSSVFSLAGNPPSDQSTETSSGSSVLDSIHLFGTARLRYEYADVDAPGLKSSQLGSLRTRFGLRTDSFHGFKFLAEGEYTWILTPTDGYRAFPGFAPANRSVIADPDNFQLNRLQLSYHADAIDTTVTVGRQAINLADQRFIGAIAWRQNDQTFDAVVVENKSIKDLAITYAYLEQVNRIFGNNTPALPLSRWEGESHLVHFDYTGIENHTLRAFAYLLDFDNAAVASTDTYGIELAGKKPLRSGNLEYILTAATQHDTGNNPRNYSEQYYRAQVGFKNECCNYGIGAEIMTSNGKGGRFIFPLGTNHKFNGYADAFLATPANGLIDYYAWIGTKALGFQHTLTVHHFSTEKNSQSLGWEVDYVAAKKMGENAKFILKAAYLDGENTQVDITRASTEINFSF